MKDIITLKQSQIALMSCEAWKKNKEKDRVSLELALVVEVRKNNSIDKGGKSRSNKIHCFRCKGYENIQWDCLTKVDEGNKNKGECAFIVDNDNNDFILVIFWMYGCKF